MRVTILRLLWLLSSVALSSATHLRISVPVASAFHPASLPPSTTATLTTLSQVISSPLRADNTFDFRNVSSGSYLLEIHSAAFAFAPLRVDIHGGTRLEDGQVKETGEVEAWGTFRGNEWSNKGETIAVKEIEEASGSGQAKIFEFEVKPVAGKEYFVERTGFSPLSLLKNPMILIGGLSMIIVFGMPYLMDNMDPELRAEFEERQKASPLSGNAAASNPLQNFDAAAWLAGSSAPKKSDNNALVERGTPVERGVTR